LLNNVKRALIDYLLFQSISYYIRLLILSGYLTYSIVSEPILKEEIRSPYQSFCEQGRLVFNKEDEDLDENDTYIESESEELDDTFTYRFAEFLYFHAKDPIKLTGI
jgi:hypothetical protein